MFHFYIAMGVHPKLWDVVAKVFGSAHIHRLEGRILPPIKYSNLPALTVIDGSGKIYKLTGGNVAVPFSYFIKPLTDGIIEILKADPTNCLFVLMDRSPPNAKRANAARYTRPNSIAVETPPSQNSNKIEAWRQYATEYWMPKSDINSMLSNMHSNISETGRFEWLVPAYAATQPGQPTFNDYLNNPHFKLFFQEECCRYWAEHIPVLPNQWLAIMGSNDFFHLSRGADCEVRRSMFSFSFKEADPIIGHIIRVFDNYNLNIISDDGDVVIVALLAQHHLREHSAKGYLPVSRTKFERQCNVVNKWNSKQKSIVYFDIEVLWRSINYTILDAWNQSGTDIQGCPIMIFTIIAALNGNDYVRNLPQLSPLHYFNTFLANAENFPMLTSEWDRGLEEHIKLKCSSIVELILETYKTKFPSIVLSTKIEQTLAQIQAASGKRNVTITLADLRTRLGNLCYYLSYFLNAQYARPPPSEFKQSVDGESLYGYTVTSKDGKLAFAYTDVPKLNHIDFYLSFQEIANVLGQAYWS